MYKAVITTNNELRHFNKNHSRQNGQFISGDGDGDGSANDHKERLGGINTTSKRSSNNERPYSQQLKRKGAAKIAGGIGTMAVSSFLSMTDNEVANGIGYIGMLVGAGLSGYGAYQVDKGIRAKEMEEVLIRTKR